MDKYCLPLSYVINPNNKHDIEIDNTDQYQNEVYEKVKSFMETHGLRSVLDIGCGSGYKLMKHLKDFDTYGMETEPCYSFLKEKYPDRNWILSGTPEENFSNIDKTIGNIDIIIAVDIIEHIRDPDVLIEFCKSLKSKYLLFSTPCRHQISTQQRFINCGYLKGINGPPANNCHVREWTFPEFILYLSKNFNIIESGICQHQSECQWHIVKNLE
jgi:2-polyprenyl-3-methyl-5-hydroxy-6-metoxy-1,4-benzoquinol methylase